MEHRSFGETEEFEKEKTKIFEYNLIDRDINVCYCEIKGRYPLEGFSVNEKCKELAFVVSGNGKVCVENRTFDIKEKDVVLINKGEKFYWEGDLKLVLPCSPAWNAKQYKVVKS